MENVYDKLTLMKKYKLEPEQMLLENNIKIDEEMEISKILSVGSSVYVDMPIEAMSGECVISGKIICDLVYALESGEVNSQTSVSPFTYKLTNKNITGGAKLNIYAGVVNSEVNKLNNNQVKLISTVNFDGTIIKNAEVDYLKEAGSDTYLKQQELEVVSLLNSPCEKFEERLEATVKTGVKKVLMTNVECLIKDYTTGLNFVSVEMELCAKILYADKQEVSELQTITISKNIKQEIEASGVNKDINLDAFAVVIKENVLVDINEGEMDTVIGVNVPIMVCLDCFEYKKVLSVVDVYSCKNVLAIQNDECKNGVICKPEYLDGKIEGNVILTDAEARIDKYLATTNVCANISNSYVKDGMIYIEGVITANVIYLNDELGSLQSVQIEVPFVLDKKTDLEEDVVLVPMIGLFDVDTMVKRGREIYFDAKVKAFVNVTCENSFEIVSKIEAIGEIAPKDDAIEIYFGKAGETSWDIAKNLKIPAEVIRGQNQELSDPLEKDQNIALYFQKERKL